MKKKYWIVLINDGFKAFEILGTSTDDMALSDTIIKMQRIGMPVRTSAVPADMPPSSITIVGYNHTFRLLICMNQQYHSLKQKVCQNPSDDKS